MWTALEFYRSELFYLRFPWITRGAALGPTFLSPILGVYGASFLVVAAAVGFMYRRTIMLSVFLSLCVMGLGLIRPGLVEPHALDQLRKHLKIAENCGIHRIAEDILELSP